MYYSSPASARNSLRRFASAGAFLLLIAAKLSAQVTLSGELDTPTHSYVFFAGSPGYNGSSASLEASIKPSLTFDFSSTGDTLLTVTWSAPAGKMVVIDAPEGWNDASFGISLRGGSRTGNAFFEVHSLQGVTVFSGLTGSFLNTGFANVVFAQTNSYEVSSNTQIASGSEISFTAVSISYLLPESLDQVFASVASSEFQLTGNVSFSGIEQADPGQWVSLQDSPGSAVPEPSTYALILGAGALGFVAWRRWGAGAA